MRPASSTRATCTPRATPAPPPGTDRSGQTIADGKGAKVRITFNDARKGVRELDLTDAEAEALGGRPVARRGRRPKNT